MEVKNTQITLKICIPHSIAQPKNAFPIPLVEYIERLAASGQEIVCIDGTRIAIEITDNLSQCTFCIMPFTWDKYLSNNLSSEVLSLDNTIQGDHKYFVIWCTWDFDAIIPIRRAIQFQTGIHRSFNRIPEFAFELPVFWPDYLDIYFNGQMQHRTKQDQPSIGFCGQAASKSYKIFYWTLKNVVHSLSYKLGKAAYVPSPIRPSVLIRNKVLKNLSKSPLVDTDFIIRDSYRAGVRSKVDRDNYFHPTKIEFVNNIIGNDYTVCIRGGGNFSVRLYETLSCGRIPIFVDTDSRLPYDFILDWKKYCVWIEYQEIKYIAEKVRDFHAELSNDDFIELQNQCRRLWVEWLSRDAFLGHFFEHLIYVDRYKQEMES